MLLQALIEKRAILTKEGRESSRSRTGSLKKSGSKGAKSSSDGKGGVLYDIHGSPKLQAQVDNA